MDAIFSSLLVNDPKSFEVSVNEAMNDIAKKLSDVVNSYDPKDLPLLAAAMNVGGSKPESCNWRYGNRVVKTIREKVGGDCCC